MGINFFLKVFPFCGKIAETRAASPVPRRALPSSDEGGGKPAGLDGGRDTPGLLRSGDTQSMRVANSLPQSPAATAPSSEGAKGLGCACGPLPQREPSGWDVPAGRSLRGSQGAGMCLRAAPSEGAKWLGYAFRPPSPGGPCLPCVRGGAERMRSGEVVSTVQEKVTCYRMPVPTRRLQPLSQTLRVCQLPLHRGAKPCGGRRTGAGDGVCPCGGFRHEKKHLHMQVLFWRRRRDLNPCDLLQPYSLSRGAPSPLGYFSIALTGNR